MPEAPDTSPAPVTTAAPSAIAPLALPQRPIPAAPPVVVTTTDAPQPDSPPAPVASCGPGYYTNSSGDCVHDPASAPAAPSGATALCGDGTYSFSQHRSGTCSHHGGVQRWL
ncbi:DUF3761 domain-containing protein [Nocardia sp. SYP-A9097]|nr:DUF3761 domain-containing protein [Nocardia sp. SYP-A9097]